MDALVAPQDAYSLTVSPDGQAIHLVHSIISTISTTVTASVTLGAESFAPSLTVTGTGAVNPKKSGADGILMPAATATTLLNNGTINAAEFHNNPKKGIYGPGGDGVLAEYSDIIINNGYISGAPSADTIGGSGVVLAAGGVLTNTGGIAGGAGLYARTPAAGGDGVSLLDGGTLTNAGDIFGGAGSGAGLFVGGGNGGAGLYLAGPAVVTNSGAIRGGNGGGSDDLPFGGAPAGDGVDMLGGTLKNAGEIQGGTGPGGINGNGLNLENGTASNFGTLAGGTGGFRDAGGAGGGILAFGLAGGAGVSLSGGVLINHGIAEGGMGTDSSAPSDSSGNGGTGAIVAGGTLKNLGKIKGGNGGSGDFAGSGGIGAVLAGTGLLVNSGVILGGKGENGGIGVDMSGTTLVNTGLIIGGKGAPGLYAGSAGAGLYLDGGTLIDSGTIEGGAKARHSTLAPGDAIQFGTKNAVLILEPGAIFSGKVAANKAATDILELAGTAPGTLSGLGHAFTGFAGVTIEAGADWTLIGDNKAPSAAPLEVDGTLLIEGGLTAAGGIAVNASGRLQGDDGTIFAPIANIGGIQATAGILTLAGDVTGDGGLSAKAGASLVIAGGLTTAGTLSGAGTLLLDQAATLRSGAALNAADVVATANIRLAGGADITTSARDNFTLAAAAGATVKITGGSGATFTNEGSFTAVGPGVGEVTTVFINQTNAFVGSGTLSFLGGVINNGALAVEASQLAIATDVTGTGLLYIATAGTLALQDGADSGQTVKFLAGTGELDLSNPALFAAAIKDFAAGDLIDLIDTKATDFTYAGGELTLTNGQATVATLDIGKGYTNKDFALAPDSHGGTIIRFV